MFIFQHLKSVLKQRNNRMALMTLNVSFTHMVWEGRIIKTETYLPLSPCFPGGGGLG